MHCNEIVGYVFIAIIRQFDERISLKEVVITALNGAIWNLWLLIDDAGLTLEDCGVNDEVVRYQTCKRRAKVLQLL